MKSARIGYFLYPYNSPTDPPSPAMGTLKQCLHYDPDSPKCLKMHRLVKAFDKSFKALDKALQSDDWRGVLKLLLGASADASASDGFAAKYDAALAEPDGEVFARFLGDFDRVAAQTGAAERAVCGPGASAELAKSAAPSDEVRHGYFLTLETLGVANSNQRTWEVRKQALATRVRDVWVRAHCACRCNWALSGEMIARGTVPWALAVRACIGASLDIGNSFKVLHTALGTVENG